jgi:hypothetical protein
MMMMMMMSSGCSRVPLSKLQQLLQCKLLAKNNIDLECKLMMMRIMAEEVHGAKRRSLLCLIMDHSSCTWKKILFSFVKKKKEKRTRGTQLVFCNNRRRGGRRRRLRAAKTNAREREQRRR